MNNSLDVLYTDFIDQLNDNLLWDVEENYTKFDEGKVEAFYDFEEYINQEELSKIVRNYFLSKLFDMTVDHNSKPKRNKELNSDYEKAIKDMKEIITNYF